MAGLIKWDKTIELEDGQTVFIESGPNGSRFMTVTERPARGMPDAKPVSVKLRLNADARKLIKDEL